MSAVAGDMPAEVIGEALAAAPALDDIVRTGTVQRLHAASLASFAAGRLPGTDALVAPLRSRGSSIGALIVIDRADGDRPFDRDDELVLGPFATTAAGAIAATEALADERARLRVLASEQERRRWARELHDETLQELGALKLAQQRAAELDDPAAVSSALEEALGRVDVLIAGLEELITELRPAALDELGTQAALEDLIARIRERHALEIVADFDLAYETGRAPTRPDPELEATVYRLVQEALSNVVKHAEASQARIAVEERDDELIVTVEDDGRGLPEPRSNRGFGLLGMRERVELANGRLEVGPGASGGTRVRATLPVSREDADEPG